MIPSDQPPPDGEATPALKRRPTEPTPNLVEYPDLSKPVDWSSLFENDHSVELEIGSGKGLFLANEGMRRPEVNFFGIEVARKYAKLAALRVSKKGMTNVRVLPGDALRFLAGYTPAQSLSAVHVYFPDPWWKKRHRKRRVFCKALVLDIEKGLKPGGDLWVVTDVEEYYGVILKLMLEHPRFERQAEPVVKDPEHEHDYLTNFERKYRIEGRPIYRVHYRFDVPAQA